MVINQIWECKIGVISEEKLVSNHPLDPEMREAVEKAFKKATGLDAQFNFSGWGAELKESELAVIEDREPDIEVQIDELRRHEEIIQSGIHYHNNKV